MDRELVKRMNGEALVRVIVSGFAVMESAGSNRPTVKGDYRELLECNSGRGLRIVDAEQCYGFSRCGQWYV